MEGPTPTGQRGVPHRAVPLQLRGTLMMDGPLSLEVLTAHTPPPAPLPVSARSRPFAPSFTRGGCDVMLG